MRSSRDRPARELRPIVPIVPIVGIVLKVALPVAVTALIGLSGCEHRPPAPVVAATRAVERDRARVELRDRIRQAFLLPVTDTTEAQWRAAFWAAQFTRDTSAMTRRALRQAWNAMSGRSTEFQRALLEAIVTLCPDSYRTEALGYLSSAPNEKLFAMAAWCARPVPGGVRDIRRTMHARFPEWRAHPILNRLDLSLSPLPVRPPLHELLRARLEPGVPVVFSFQRHRRVFPGLAVFRLPSGKFLREDDGRLFAVTQLALSLSDLPGFLTNGNTPQGIHTMQGTAISREEYIGPTTTLQMRLPFEASPSEFTHGSRTDSGWSPAVYADLLPPSWRDYPPIAEAYDAGRAGRFDIIAHGTTIDPSFYRGEPFFPNTPSLGCLCAPERWSAASGERVTSEQQRLVDALARNGGARGYVVVVDLDDEPRPVEPWDLLPEIIRAEGEGVIRASSGSHLR